ncbi:DUF3106 domain-containing protein [Massilia sp. SYSU DXS3249]
MTTPQSKPRRGALFAVVVGVLAAIAAWLFWGGDRSGAPGAGSAVTATSAATAQPDKSGPQLFHKPLWQDLSNAQQLALQPLKNEWDVMEGTRKRKWLEMSRRFASMSREEQERVHERMRQWVRLTPEQRNLARENYTRTRKLAPGEKTATWESYKQLTPDQKRRLAQTARKNPATTETPSSTMIVAPTSCPPGTTRRGATCMSLQAPASIPAAPAITQPAPVPAAPAGAAPAPAVGAPAVPSAPTPTTVAPTASNANG